MAGTLAKFASRQAPLDEDIDSDPPYETIPSVPPTIVNDDFSVTHQDESVISAHDVTKGIYDRINNPRTTTTSQVEAVPTIAVAVPAAAGGERRGQLGHRDTLQSSYLSQRKQLLMQDANETRL